MAPRVPAGKVRFVCGQCRQALNLLAKKRRFASTASTSPEIYDVVTVGGGPAGLALLAALKSSPVTSHLKTALIETQDLSKTRRWNLSKDQFSNRASSLTPTSVAFLKSTGVWDHVDQSRVQAYDEMQVWDAGNGATMQFDWRSESQRYNAPPQTVATMTENANLTRGLLERLAQLGAEPSLLSSTRVSSIENGKDDPQGINLSTWPILELDSTASTSTNAENTSKVSIAARLLVGADGFNSPVRTFAGINSNGWDYNRHGVVATVNIQSADAEDQSFDSLFSEEGPSNRATAYQRFLPQLGGPIAILPLPNNHASLVWSTNPQNAAYLKSLSPASQTSMINAALRLSQTDLKYLLTLGASSAETHESELRWRLQHTSLPPTLNRPPPIISSIQENTLASFPLRFRHATSLIGPRIALLGDAAHTMHPLAGQGLNLGLADAKSLAATIAYAVEHGMDIGDMMALERYSQDRFGKGLLLSGGVDLLNSLYQLGGGSEGPSVIGGLLSRARGLGMRAIDAGWVPGLKGLIMKQAT